MNALRFLLGLVERLFDAAEDRELDKVRAEKRKAVRQRLAALEAQAAAEQKLLASQALIRELVRREKDLEQRLAIKRDVPENPYGRQDDTAR